MKTKLLTTAIVCALLISLTGCATDNTAQMLRDNAEVTVNTEAVTEPSADTQAVTLTAERQKKKCLPSQLQRKHRRQVRHRKPIPQENWNHRSRQNRPGRLNPQKLRSRMLRASRRNRSNPSQRSHLLRLHRQSTRRPNRQLQRSLPHRLSLLRPSKQSLLWKRSQRPHTIMSSISMRSKRTVSPSVRAWAMR